jgi:amino acid transporter
MTAVLACFGSALLACSRTLYALAREGFAPQVLAAVHPRGRIPWNAQLLVLSLVAVLPIGLGAWQGSYLAAFGWGGQLLVFFVLLPYVAVNLANTFVTCAGGGRSSTGSSTVSCHCWASPSTAT